MSDSFELMKEDLSKKDPRSIVGIALCEAAEYTDNMVVLYADVGRRFDLDKVKSAGGGGTLS